jgi:hypothetical protein
MAAMVAMMRKALAGRDNSEPPLVVVFTEWRNGGPELNLKNTNPRDSRAVNQFRPD